MPSPRAVLADIERLKLPHHKNHSYLDATGRLKGSAVKAVEVAKVVEQVAEKPAEPAPVEAKGEEVPVQVAEAAEAPETVVEETSSASEAAATDEPAVEKKAKKKKVEKKKVEKAEKSAD
jgi:hypothetical protein